MQKDIKKIYPSIRKDIESRLKEFGRIWKKGSEEEIFAELVFCILTPQSKARYCWKGVERLISKGLLLRGGRREILRELTGVRFKSKKAEYIIKARKKFQVNGRISIRPWLRGYSDVFGIRERLVRDIKGIGYKEASHFLRNIGFGRDIAILDRHILKNLKAYKVIDDIPESLPRRRYFEIEGKMREFASNIKIPLSHLDFILWYKEAGEVFK